MRRRLIAAAALAALAPAAASAAPGSSSWARPQIAVVVAQGLMDASTPAAFRPNDRLTQQALANLAADLQARLAPPQPPAPAPPPASTDPASTDPAATTTTTATTTTATTTAPAPAPSKLADPNAPATIAQLDARLVQALGAADAAAAFARGARAAGLVVPGRFGTEVAARLLGLRTNHPAGLDDLELLPNDPATRAEAAYSAAQILGFRGWERDALASAAQSFALPQLTPWQRRILDTAVRFVGYPYVWGGTSEHTETLFGVTSRGGFDCSGFVWRVYKLQAYPGEGRLASVLRGRTTFQMSGEVPRGRRIPLAKLQPADVLFWGAHGPRSKPAEVDHAGIYLGNGWFVQSSGSGVDVEPLQGWYRERFAWGRRPLAEAGLQ